MPEPCKPWVNADLAEICDQATRWRRALHQIPELMYDLPETRAFVLERLHAFGCATIHEQVGRAGIVAVIEGNLSGNTNTLAIRADMDALPIDEQTGRSYRSRTAGQMHACGHDGHTAILLATGCYLAQHRHFPGRVVLVFQPAEEGGFGARDMLDAGFIETFGISEIYGLHNLPGRPIGTYATRVGPLLAASDRFEITITGHGTHAATPHLGVDPIAAGATLVSRINTIVSRQINPLSHCVISLGSFNAGKTHNVIPKTAKLTGTVRALSTTTQTDIRAALQRVCDGVASETSAEIDLDYRLGHPVTENQQCSVDTLRHAAERASLKIDEAPLHMFSEDFSFMLQARPGAFIFTGNGASAPLHDPAYDFNDAAIIAGVKAWLALAYFREI